MPLGRWALYAALAVAALAGAPGCMLIPRLGTDRTGHELGQTWYVGGAGPFGNIGTIDVPKGLRNAGYPGAIEVFGWQSILGGTLRDQIDRTRNEAQARKLAESIMRYLDEHPGQQANIVALSAGTGITAWALEMLPPHYRVGNVVFLGSSLSRDYNLTAALSRVDGRLYSFHSTRDPVLRYGVSVTGSVDRESFSPSAAGLYGFSLPANIGDDGLGVYKRRLRNRPYQSSWARWGYRGYHTDSTSVEFARHIVAPLVMQPLDPTERPAATVAAPAPSSRPSGRVAPER